MITGQTELYCVNSRDDLKEGQIYTFDRHKIISGYVVVTVKEFQDKWYNLERFELIDQSYFLELKNILVN